jgi:hypothetical protein
LTSEEEDRFLSAFEVDGELGDIVEVGRLHRTYGILNDNYSDRLTTITLAG